MTAKGNRTRIMGGLVVLAVVFVSLIPVSPAAGAAPMENYCVIPPFIGATAPPLVMLMMERDDKLFRRAYDDTSDLGHEVDGNWVPRPDGVVETTYKHIITYAGYFDSYKCYDYSSVSQRFSPASETQDKYCSGNWSGNFLNWATMTRIDILRQIFFGGNRAIDSSTTTPHAVLERAFLPQDAHSFVKIYTCVEGGACDISKLTPYTTHPVFPDKQVSKLSICNTTRNGYGEPPLMRVATGDDNAIFRDFNIPGWDRWAAAERWQCAVQGEVAQHSTPMWHSSFETDCSDALCDGWIDFDGASYDTIITNVAGGVSGKALQVEIGAGDVFADGTTNPGVVFKSIITTPGKWYMFRYFSKKGTAPKGELWLATTGESLKLMRDLYSLRFTNTGWERRQKVFQAMSNKTWITLLSYGNQPGQTTLFDEVEVFELTDIKPAGIASEDARPEAGDLLDDLVVRVEACKDGLLGRERCKLYEQHNNWMPVGLIQEYGEDSSMYFGLMTGSYDRNKSGGVLRAELSDFGDLNSSDLNRTTGVFTSNAGILPTIRDLSITNYDYANGMYNTVDDCPGGLSGFSDGQCSNWGNPLAEMYYETMRYFVGKDVATEAYKGSDSNIVLPNINLATTTWNSQLDPFMKSTVAECSDAFVLVLSDAYPSYDSDQLPGGAFGSIASDLPTSLPALNVSTLADQVGAIEGIDGKEWFVGESGPLNDGLCTAKTVTSLSTVRGLCPAEPGREGSYYLPAMAFYGQRTDLRPDDDLILGKPGNQNLTTYAIEMGGSSAELNIDMDGSPIKVIPACFNRQNNKPCALIDFKYAAAQVMEYGVDNPVLFDIYYFSWEDSQQGGDYDNDVDGQIWIGKDTALNRLIIMLIVGGKSTDSLMDIGYIASGTTQDGVYLPIKVNELCTMPAHNWRLPSGALNSACLNSKVFYAGTNVAGSLKSPLWYAAKYGGYRELNAIEGPDLENEWDANGDGKPDTYFDAMNILQLEKKLVDAFSAILNRVTSGTAASVLASGEGSGANLVQAVYYPRKRFLNSEMSWLGSLHNFWYQAAPFFTASNIREDTPASGAEHGDKILNLTADNIVKMFFDEEALRTKAELYTDSDGDGVPDNPFVPDYTKEFGDVDPIWKAGLRLWARDLALDPRNIYTRTGGGGVIDFSVANAAVLAPLMNVPDTDGNGDNLAETEDVIRYTRGEHIVVDRDGDGALDYRSRLADIDLNGDGDAYDTVTLDMFGDGSRATREVNVWKLGDIVDSTPRIASTVAINVYHKEMLYNDATYGDFISDPINYKARGRVYVGANDGMLHAFTMGVFENMEGSFPQIARLNGSNLGREEWAFIPLNSLPYLQYMLDPDYCHVNTIDLSPFLIDASVAVDADPYGDGRTQPGECNNIPGAPGSENCIRSKKSWRTILIGGMRFGGACKAVGSNAANGVEVPLNAEIDGTTTGLGYSSYFAFDVTEENSPKFLWEFSHPEMGFTTTGPAVVRLNGFGINNQPDVNGNERNGKWYAIFGSGPTGPIDSTYHQFMGYSDQNLKLFVLNLLTGELVKVIDTGVAEAFAGSILTSSLDSDEDYADNILYIGYTRNESPSKEWNRGGIGRLIINGNVDPSMWVWSLLIDDIGPVTAGVGKIYDRDQGRFWVYAATGRYFYKLPKKLDDPISQQALYGILDRCYDVEAEAYKPACLDTDPTNDETVDPATLFVSADTVTRETEAATIGASNANGWIINLDAADTDRGFGAERAVTDVVATTEGFVYFTTFKPHSGACKLGGESHVWIVWYENGGAPLTGLKGKAMVQVSTGAIEELDLKSALDNEESRGGRRTGSMQGVPPTAQGLALMGAPAPSGKVLHVKER